MASGVYRPIYIQSWALIIGINKYEHAGPLGYARQDAEAIAEILNTRGFPQSNIKLLVDAAATREAIRRNFLDFSNDHVSPDDRIFIFFAGHGHTRTGSRGEIGYLIPVDGRPKDLTTLIRWDELTRDAELIPAKHVFFVMDACYGGLAITRALAPGSSRFLKDMLLRPARQVLTAGKADEAVADFGGPIPGHSVFTGHLIQALEGAAASDGIITANGVMAYVYDRVAKDAHSNQSPHYGFLDGDGDLIFAAPQLNALDTTPETDSDQLVQVPAVQPQPDIASYGERISTIKDFLSDRRYRIRLQDAIAQQVREARQAIEDAQFSLTAPFTPDELTRRLRAYESATADLQESTILLGRWGEPEHRAITQMIVARLNDGITSQGGNLVWLQLRWYPILLLLYTGGIAALSAGNYDQLATLFHVSLQSKATGTAAREAIVAATDGFREQVSAEDLFKTIPGHERHLAPLSEYLFKSLQPTLEDALFLGNSYEQYYDRFEILYALEYADFRRRSGSNVWGPIGRFGWKHRRGYGLSEYDQLIKEAVAAGNDWGPLKAGLFAGSIGNFETTAYDLQSNILARLPW
jgi:hypothetical protein